jgi:hypothetical protein
MRTNDMTCTKQGDCTEQTVWLEGDHSCVSWRIYFHLHSMPRHAILVWARGYVYDNLFLLKDYSSTLRVAKSPSLFSITCSYH